MFGLFEPGDLKHTRFYQEIKEEAMAEERERLLPLVIAVFLEHGVTAEQIAVKMEIDVATIKLIMQRQEQSALLNQLEA
jgi:predicted transposase YdaD